VHVLHVGATAIGAMTGDALVARAGVLIVGVALAAGHQEVAPAQRKLGAIVIEAHQRPAIGAMALAAVEQRSSTMRIAVAGAALRVEPAICVMAGGATNRLVAAVERKGRLAVIERRHVREFGRRVAFGAVASELIAV